MQRWLVGWHRLFPRGIMSIQSQACQLRQGFAKPKALSTVGIRLSKRPHDIFVAQAVIAAQRSYALREVEWHLLLTGSDPTEKRHS